MSTKLSALSIRWTFIKWIALCALRKLINFLASFQAFSLYAARVRTSERTKRETFLPSTPNATDAPVYYFRTSINFLSSHYLLAWIFYGKNLQTGSQKESFCRLERARQSTGNKKWACRILQCWIFWSLLREYLATARQSWASLLSKIRSSISSNDNVLEYHGQNLCNCVAGNCVCTKAMSGQRFEAEIFSARCFTTRLFAHTKPPATKDKLVFAITCRLNSWRPPCWFRTVCACLS